MFDANKLPDKRTAFQRLLWQGLGMAVFTLSVDIKGDLQARGLTQVSGPSDLNVRYHFGAARKTQVETYPAGWYGLRTRVVRVPYSEGTLVIDLRDPSTRALVWRSIASEEKSDATKIEGKLDDMVKKSFDKYPPKK